MVLSIDLLTDGRCDIVVAVDSPSGVLIDGAMVEAIDMVRALSWPLIVDEAMLAVRVCAPGAPYPG